MRPVVHTPQVLLIDDSLEDLALLIALLNGRQIRVHVAFDGEDGFHKAQLIQPDLILLDVAMPKTDGFAACRWLKAQASTRSIPIIFLSAFNEPSKRIEGLKLGAVDFIGKPFVEEEVVTRIQIHLNLAKSPSASAPSADPLPPALHFVNPLSPKEALIVSAAITFLQQNLAQTHSLDALAKQAGCNSKRLTAAFKQATGMTVFAWLRQTRLRQARDWLVHSDIPIAAIAERFGYTSQANFAKAFREHYGCSATQLREGAEVPLCD
ncbi:MAG: response regulator [Thiomicrospira sp.]